MCVEPMMALEEVLVPPCVWSESTLTTASPHLASFTCLSRRCLVLSVDGHATGHRCLVQYFPDTQP